MQIHDEHDLYELLPNLSGKPLILILDSITDPHNFGACLRSAEAAGVNAVIFPKDRSSGINETVRHTACGAAESLFLVEVTNLARVMKKLKELGVWLMGTSDKAIKNMYDMDFTDSTAIVMGSEGNGLRRLTSENCDFLIRIPMAGQVESLNVSVATGVILFEAVRQRLKKSR